MPNVISDLHRQSNLSLSHSQNLLVGLLSVFLYILNTVRDLSQVREPGLVAQLVAAPLLEELRLSLEYQVRQSRRSRPLE